jgi:hypothetical protein
VLALASSKKKHITVSDMISSDRTGCLISNQHDDASPRARPERATKSVRRFDNDTTHSRALLAGSKGSHRRLHAMSASPEPARLLHAALPWPKLQSPCPDQPPTMDQRSTHYWPAASESPTLFGSDRSFFVSSACQSSFIALKHSIAS